MEKTEALMSLGCLVKFKLKSLFSTSIISFHLWYPSLFFSMFCNHHNSSFLSFCLGFILLHTITPISLSLSLIKMPCHCHFPQLATWTSTSGARSRCQTCADVTIPRGGAAWSWRSPAWATSWLPRVSTQMIRVIMVPFNCASTLVHCY